MANRIQFNNSNTGKPNYFYFVIILGQFLGLLPLVEEKSGKTKVLRFKAHSIKVIYCVAHIVCVMLMTGMCAFHAGKNGFQFKGIGKLLL